jgi:cell wall-associated NlpC family hydrolase
MPPVSQGETELTTRSRAFAALALAAALVVNATPVSAVPRSKLAQARSVKAQVDRLDARVEAAAERYNEASARHAKLAAQERKAAARYKKVKKRLNKVQTHLGVRANSMYRDGPMVFLDVLFGSESFEEFATTWDVLRAMNANDAQAITDLKVLRAEADSVRQELDAKERAAKRQALSMRRNRDSIQRQLAERKRRLRGLEHEIARLEAAEEARRSSSAGRWVHGGGRTFPPPTRAPRGAVVSVARRYLGAPYRWGAAGPNSFDCSGLVMYVYRQVGVYLPHSSRAQINYGERVSRSDLAPGDLVFFGSPIHHVGMYVGGGMFIHAPHTGDVVRISPLNRGDYAGACRP